MLNFNNIIREASSKYRRNMDEKIAQDDLNKEEVSALSIARIISYYVSALGKNDRRNLYDLFINTHKDYQGAVRLIKRDIKKALGTNVELYRGLTITAHNGDFQDKKVGTRFKLEAYKNMCMGFTDDEYIAECFAKMGEGLPSGIRDDDVVDTVRPEDAKDMIGFVLRAKINTNDIIYIPDLFDDVLSKDILKKAEKASNYNTNMHALKEEREYIVVAPQMVEIIGGYVWDDETMEYTSSDHPYEDWLNEHAEFEDGEI